MAFTTSQYSALVAAITTGATEVNYGDKKVTYRSVNEMIRIKNMMEAELGINKTKSKKVLTSFNKGL